MRFVGNPEWILSKLALTPVTTRIVLRGKKAVKLCLVTAKTKCRAISNAVVLNCELFTGCHHARLDNNLFYLVALIFVDSPSPIQLIATMPLDLLIG